ncbi:NrdR family transcriptional regulator [Thermosipho melanesiensis]|uniref:Transcriptional repressor NrdR n=2 Tax=Thermosipho melanesiensis TaxID=46541 RepID=NRDR_THEM4|nr:transcriptional regulator NrdR [Thermosipho melanesiensis]A6LMS2.1 RecName: Full=Transcriptional repressor NrdR [Thermosipho melanesiensis BI429]ABR31223.1 ATP-cone domain protein [Thermosipho melanesiensis BI429]APT74307.1 NrdR family transcriptional regulator [Thermosipho melanesiensis]OOC36248.1 NrdR family transcriptional regulator [Thermosipho melanesiensis]OOC37066.1 NrdR family transcriptional regulator [Thermosipho melanesiensis]OOC37818.1 NrdR family transcriptional regulator [The
MRCPYCGYEETRVLDSRVDSSGMTVRRRRECVKCKGRFTTYERYEFGPVFVVKKDGKREKFDRAKILNGVMKACEKTNVTLEEIEKLVDDVVNDVQKSGNLEILTLEIGKLVMEKLKKLNGVAYVRFASVYKDFREIDQFLEVVEELKKEK